MNQTLTYLSHNTRINKVMSYQTVLVVLSMQYSLGANSTFLSISKIRTSHHQVIEISFEVTQTIWLILVKLQLNGRRMLYAGTHAGAHTHTHTHARARAYMYVHTFITETG